MFILILFDILQLLVFKLFLLCALHSTEAMAVPPAQNFVLMRNWETNQVVGWWVHTERNQLGIGLVSDYFPEFEAQQREADGSVVAVPEMVPYHEHRNGYLFLRLPGPKPNKVLFHRQLWQDLNNRKLRSQEEVHHINGDPGCNLSTNLVMLAAREHRQQHARWRRGPVGLQGRIRGPRHNQRRDVYIYIIVYIYIS